VLSDILSGVGGQEPPFMNKEHQLIDKLKETLKNKRYACMARSVMIKDYEV
jgi:hypothetical protein